MAQSIGANLLPCQTSTKGKHKSELKNVGLDWHWGFVRMEHLLLKSLTHPQMRFYLFIVLIYRAHLKEETGLDMKILRYLYNNLQDLVSFKKCLILRFFSDIYFSGC